MYIRVYVRSLYTVSCASTCVTHQSSRNHAIFQSTSTLNSRAYNFYKRMIHPAGFMMSGRRTLEISILAIMVITIVTSLPLCHDKTCILKTGEEFLREEKSQGVGGKITLNEREQKVDSEILSPIKSTEVESRSKYDWLKNVSENELFKFIRNMPKGGDLHIHDISMVNIQWVVKELTYLPNLYYCTVNGGKLIRFRFSENEPEKENFCETTWFSVEEKREEFGSEIFDEMLYDKMTMDRDVTADEDTAWDRFLGAINAVSDLVYSEKGFRPYFKQALTEFYQDNVLYLEVRTLMLPLLCDNGTTLDREVTLRRYIEVTEEFKKENPGFIGAKFILLSVRSLPSDVIETDLRLAVTLRQKYPDYLPGYDLVGYEKFGKPHKDLVDILLIPSREGIDLPYFFHAGETKQLGMDTDENLLYAILLNTTRIGHGFSLTKHPNIMEIVEKRGIPIEVSPVSNQMLSLVQDHSNHPAIIFFSRNMPVVICSDDPAPWRTSGLSYDYFIAFVYFTKADDGLAVLKEISRNGIKYSAMKENDKNRAMEVWQQQWDQFIESMLQGHESIVDVGHVEL